jgi:hypothetical protein
VARNPEHRVVRLLAREHVDPDVEPVAARERARIADPFADEPGDVG